MVLEIVRVQVRLMLMLEVIFNLCSRMARETFSRRAIYERLPYVRDCKTTHKSSQVMESLIGLQLMTALVYLYGTKKLHRV